MGQGRRLGAAVPGPRRLLPGPEYGAWIGFSAREVTACALLLVGAGGHGATAAGAGRRLGRRAVALPGKWTAMKSRLVHLGPAGGKFCLAIMYDRIDDEVFAQGTVRTPD